MDLLRYARAMRALAPAAPGAEQAAVLALADAIEAGPPGAGPRLDRQEAMSWAVEIVLRNGAISEASSLWERLDVVLNVAHAVEESLAGAE